MENGSLCDAVIEPSRRVSRRRWAVILAGFGALVGAAILFTGTVGRGEGGSVVAADELLDTTTVPTFPEPLRPVDPATLEDGYYLRIATKVFTNADEPLLVAAQELLVEAQAAGYTGAKIVRRPASASTCTTNGCIDGMPAVGYIVILNGPYQMPIDVQDEYEWRRQMWLQEVEAAKARGLTVEPSIYWYNFD